MAIYQTPSARFFEYLRNAGVVVLLIIVLKGFLSSPDPVSSRQASVETKGLRPPYSGPILTADGPSQTDSYPTPYSQEENGADDGIVDKVIVDGDDDDDDQAITQYSQEDDDDDGIVDTGAVIFDGDDDDQAIAAEPGNEPPNSVSLHLIGERHSGTKWMSSHLEKCFPNVRFSNNPFRWKHWFQDEAIEKYPGERFVVVAQFRNPYTWTEAMRSFPHHAAAHFHLHWPEFVTRTWTMPRVAADLEFTGWNAETSRDKSPPVCASGEFLPHQVIPCMADRRVVSAFGVKMKALYELRNDGSGKPYDNILEMRQAKTENFLSVADFDRVQDLYVVRYEEAKLHGTAKLIAALEEALGQKAACKPEPGDPTWRERSIPNKLREYLKTHVHWETEEKIGYFPTDWY